MNKTQTAIPVRRIVTGHDAHGKSIIVHDDVSPFTLSETRIPGLVVTDLWKTFSTPANTTDGAEPCSSTITLTPPKNGSVFRTVQFPRCQLQRPLEPGRALCGHGQRRHARPAGRPQGRHAPYALD
ncbi:hypothetical protein [Neopusillimonas aromaticivorans]|uniref:hypothetical protein n=1 Tax=Neopusillimonas aromaticivorans TaxID=2979868 RepID=UPI002597923A|nr:hypothetical protein [Neopusillimonas aromaticivorans]WJJ92554.1 hypothetical protein N7E01_09235 [Neopusillimonas aromaticivorans]